MKNKSTLRLTATLKGWQQLEEAARESVEELKKATYSKQEGLVVLWEKVIKDVEIYGSDLGELMLFHEAQAQYLSNKIRKLERTIKRLEKEASIK